MTEFKIERARRTQARLRLALTATSNGGKTWSSILLAKGIVEHYLSVGILSGTIEGKIGMIDTERKSAALYSHLCPFDCISLNPPYTAERYAQALGVLEAAGYRVIIVDQISHAWSGPGGMLALLNKVAKERYYGNTFNAFGDITPAQDAFIDRLLASPADLIVTMRQKTEWILEEKTNKNGVTKMAPRRIGTKPVQRDGVEYEFTTLLGLDTDTHLASPLKNRCPVFQDGVSVMLNEGVGQKLAEWMLGGAPLAAEQVREPTALERAIAIVEAAEGYLPACPNMPDLARRFEDALTNVRAYKDELDPRVRQELVARLITAKDRQKTKLEAGGTMVKDLQEGDMRPEPPPEPSVMEKTQAIVKRIGDERKGVMDGLDDDLPWKD